MPNTLPSTTSSVVIGWTFWLLLPVFIIFLTFVYKKHHTVFPLNNRPISVMMFFLPALFFASLFTPIIRMADLPCDISLGIMLLCENVFFTFYLIRGMYVLFQLRVIEIVNRVTEWTATEEEKQRGKNDWYMLNAKVFLRDKMYLVFLGLDILIAIIVVIVAALVSNTSNNGAPFNTACFPDAIIDHPVNIARLATFAIKLLLMAYMAVKLLPYGNDSALVKSEIRLVSLTAVPVLVLHFVLLAVTRDHHSLPDLALSAYMVMILICTMLSVARPAYLALYMDVDSEAYYYQGRQPDISNLADIINSKVGYQVFLQFLRSEFSEENLLFWREVQTFVNKCQKLLQGATMRSDDMNKMLETKLFNREITAELSNTALKIFDMYCKRGAEAQVNISDTVLHELQMQLSNLQAERVEVVLDKISNLFDSVKSQVFELMDKDSFARFKQSPLFNNLRASMVTSGWVDTSGGETMDSFDLPVGLITVLDQDAERVKAMERRKEAQKVKPEVVRQQKKDIRASKMLAIAAKMNRRHLMDINNKSHLTAPTEVQSVVYPFKVPQEYLDQMRQKEMRRSRANAQGNTLNLADVASYEHEEPKSILRTSSAYTPRAMHGREQRVMIDTSFQTPKTMRGGLGNNGAYLRTPDERASSEVRFADMPGGHENGSGDDSDAAYAYAGQLHPVAAAKYSVQHDSALDGAVDDSMLDDTDDEASYHYHGEDDGAEPAGGYPLLDDVATGLSSSNTPRHSTPLRQSGADTYAQGRAVEMTPVGAQRIGSHVMLKRIDSGSTTSHNQSINITFASEGPNTPLHRMNSAPQGSSGTPRSHPAHALSRGTFTPQPHTGTPRDVGTPGWERGAPDSGRSVRRQPSQVIGDMVVENLDDDDEV